MHETERREVGCVKKGGRRVCEEVREEGGCVRE